MSNLDIKKYAKVKKVKLWQVSEKLGYAHDTAFSKALRHELSDEKKQKFTKLLMSWQNKGGAM